MYIYIYILSNESVWTLGWNHWGSFLWPSGVREFYNILYYTSPGVDEEVARQDEDEALVVDMFPRNYFAESRGLLSRRLSCHPVNRLASPPQEAPSPPTRLFAYIHIYIYMYNTYIYIYIYIYL